MIGNLESNYEYWKEQNESDSSQEPKAEDNIQEKLKAEGAEVCVRGGVVCVCVCVCVCACVLYV